MMNKPTQPLDFGYQPTKFDVLCGRGSTYFLHEGNKRFRQLILAYLERFTLCKSRMDKSALVIEIVAAVCENGGHFLRSDKEQQWHDIGDRLAREKVGHALREAKLSNNNNKNKSRRKRDRPSTKSRVAPTTAPDQELYSENPPMQQQQQKQQQELLRDETHSLGHKWEPLPLVDSSTTELLSDLDGFVEVMLGLAAEEGTDSDPTMAKLEEDQAWSADLEPSLCYQTLFREFQ